MSYKVDNVELYDLIVKHKRKLEINPEARIPERLGVLVQIIAKGMASRPNFTNYQFKEDAISLGIYYCLRYLKGYKEEKLNAHAWCSIICERAFIHFINEEKKKLYVRYKSQLNADSIMNMTDTTNAQILKGNAGDFTKMEVFVQDYEETVKKRNDKKQKKIAQVESLAI